MPDLGPLCALDRGEILKDLGERVSVRAIRKKPFFWDT